MKKMILLLGLCGCFSSWGYNQETQTLADELWQDIRPHVYVLPEDIEVYHYFGWNTTKDESRVVDLKDPRFQSHFLRTLGAFWSSTRYVDNLIAGEGLYAATDPSISADGFFGRTLLKIKLKKGMQFIDLERAEVPSSLAKKIFSRKTNLLGKKIENKSVTYILDMYRDYCFKNSCSIKSIMAIGGGTDNVLRELVKVVFQQKNIQAMAYSFGSRNSLICPQELHKAFVLFGHPRTEVDAQNGVVEDPLLMEAQVLTTEPGTLTGEKKIVYEEVEKVKLEIYRRRFKNASRTVQDGIFYSLGNLPPMTEPEIKEYQSKAFGCLRKFPDEYPRAFND